MGEYHWDLCVLVQLSLLLAVCWVALLVVRGGSCASEALGRWVTPLGVGTGCLGSPVPSKRVAIMSSGTLDVRGRRKRVPQGLQRWQP